MKIIVFGAHPDDEVIGLGGTLKKWAQAGADIRLILFSAGAEGYTQPGGRDRIIAQRRADAVARVAGENLPEVASLRPVVDRYFDKVLVNAPDVRVRANRLAFLAQLLAKFSSVADFSEIVTSGLG